MSENKQRLITLAKKGDIRRKADQDITELVADLRAEEVPWSEIGRALKVSRQAVWRKYSRLDRRDPAAYPEGE